MLKEKDIRVPSIKDREIWMKNHFCLKRIFNNEGEEIVIKNKNMFNKLKKQVKENEQWVKIEKSELIKIIVKTYNEGYNNGKEGKKNISKEIEKGLEQTIKTT